MASEASIGLRVYLEDSVSAGLSAIGNVLSNFQSQVEEATVTASDNFQNLAESVKATEETISNSTEATDEALAAFRELADGILEDGIAFVEFSAAMGATDEAARQVSATLENLDALGQMFPELAPEIQKVADAFVNLAVEAVNSVQETAKEVVGADTTIDEATRTVNTVLGSAMELWSKLPQLFGELAPVTENLSTEFNGVGQAIVNLIDPTEKYAINLSALGEWFANLAKEVPALTQPLTALMGPLSGTEEGVTGLVQALQGLSQQVFGDADSVQTLVMGIQGYVQALHLSVQTTSALAAEAQILAANQNTVTQSLLSTAIAAQVAANAQNQLTASTSSTNVVQGAALQQMTQLKQAAVDQATALDASAAAYTKVDNDILLMQASTQQAANATADATEAYLAEENAIGQMQRELLAAKPAAEEAALASEQLAQALAGLSQVAANAAVEQLSKQYLDLAGQTSNVANYQRSLIEQDLQASGANGNYIASLKDLSNELAGTGNNAEGAGGKFRSMFGAMMLIGMLNGPIQQLDSAVKGAITDAGDMQQAFIRVGNATQATGPQLSQLQQKIVTMAETSSFSTTEMAQGFQTLGERGFTTSDILNTKLAPAVENLAEVTGSNMVDSANLVSTSLQVFGQDASHAEDFSNALFYGFNHGLNDVNGLESALSHLGPAASSLHIPFNDIIGVMSILAQHGMPDVSQQGTTLNYMMQALAAPTSTAAKTMEALGVSAYDSNGKMKSLPDVLQQVFTALSTQSGSQAAEDFRNMFNIRSGQAAKILAQVPDINAALAKINGQINLSINNDTVQKSADDIRNTFNNKLHELQTTWTSTLGNMFTPLMQALTPILGDLNTFVGTLNNANPQLKLFVGAFAGLLAVLLPLGIAAAGVAVAFVMLDGAMAPILVPLAIIGGIILALALAGAALVTYWGPISKFLLPLVPIFQNMGKIIKSSFAPALQQMKDGWNEILLSLKPVMPYLKDAGEALGAIGLVILALVTGVLSAIGPYLGAIIHGIAGVIAGVISFVGGYIEGVKGVVQTIIGVFQVLFGWITGNKSLEKAGQSMITKGMGNIVGGILRMVQGIFQVIGSVITGFINATLGLIGHFITGFIGFFLNLTGNKGAVGAMNKTVNDLIKIISGFPQQALKWIENLINGIVNWFEHLADVLYKHSIVPDMVKAILGIFQGWWNDGVKLIQGFILGIITVFTGLPPSVSAKIGQMIQAVGGAITGANKTVSGWITDHIVTPITNTVNGLINSAEQWGSNLLKMLGQGIANGVSGLMGQVTGVANNIKGALGFHSPTKEGPLSDSDEYMPNMMKMFAGGILSHAFLVHAAVNHVASGIQSGMNTPVVARLQAANAQSASALANGQAQNTTINLNVDGKQVGQAVFNHLTGQMQLNGLNRAWR